MELEVRIDRLEEALTRLAQAQARTEERVSRLEDAVARLAQAQARTEERVSRLEDAVARLAQAQARTESAVLTLAQQVGRLSETIGFTLEDLAREVAPAYLAQHHRLHVAQLDRRFFTVDGDEVEVDLYGEGEQDGKPIVVIGEVRSRIYGRDVENAAQRAGRLRPQLPGAPVEVLFGFVIHPSARIAAQRLDAIVISSSGRPDRW
jgi:TolA-binding protein